MPSRKVSHAGFTLLELMLAGALVGILAAIAVPAYTTYVERTNQRRAEADIAALSLQLTRWELNNGAYPASLADAGLDGQQDPWGNDYIYLNMDGATTGQMRKDKNLNPLNTDYDLYSMGPDGDTKKPLTSGVSQDDIIRANNGSFIGIAEDY